MTQYTARKHPWTISRIVGTALLYVMLLIVIILVIYPLSFTVSSAFSESNSLSGLSIYPFTKNATVDTVAAEAIGADAYALPESSFSEHDVLYVQFPQTNAGDAPTLDIGGHGALPLLIADKAGNIAPLTPEAIDATKFYSVQYNGSALVLLKAYAKPMLPTHVVFAGFSTVQFEKLFKETKYANWYLNTLKIAAINSLLSVCVTTVAAYIFSRFRFKGKKPMLMSMLILQMFPSFAGMIATYVLVWRMGLLDNHFGLILVYAAGSLPYNTWLIKGYLDSIPRSLDEAARVDGAGYFLTFRKIILPIARPMVTFLAVTSFTGPWMDFIMPRLLLKSDANKTLAVGLFEMIRGKENNKFTMFAAGAVLVSVPFMILFAINQQYMTQVLATGAVKE